MKYQEREGRREGEKESKQERKVIKEGTDMDRVRGGGGITDWTEIKRQNDVRKKGGEMEGKSEEKGEGKGSRVKSKLSSLPRAQFPGHD